MWRTFYEVVFVPLIELITMRLMFLLFFLHVFGCYTSGQSNDSPKSLLFGLSVGLNYSASTPQNRITQLVDKGFVYHNLKLGKIILFFFKEKCRLVFHFDLNYLW